MEWLHLKAYNPSAAEEIKKVCAIKPLDSIAEVLRRIAETLRQQESTHGGAGG